MNFSYLISLAVFIFYSFINIVIKDNTLAGMLEFIFIFPTLYGMYKLRTKQNIDQNATLLSYFLFLTILSVIFIFKFQECIGAWALLFPFTAMSLHGSKKGLKVVMIFNTILYLTAFYFWTNSYIPMMGFFRYINVSLVISILVYLYETSIEASFQKQQELHKALDAKIKETKKLAITDSLTKLYNKRHFDTLFKEEFNRAKRENEPFILAIMDIDNFKLYNDTYGHKAGDDVLDKIGHILKQQTSRSGDYSFRIGGEEFAILLQSKSKENVLNYFEKILNKIIKKEIEHINNKPYNIITISIGVVSIINYKDITKSKCYQIADKNLYFVKNSGKNSIKLSTI
jgi:diguanylate cyclase (GGDEF)-like protein